MFVIIGHVYFRLDAITFVAPMRGDECSTVIHLVCGGSVTVQLSYHKVIQIIQATISKNLKETK